jgi:ribosomal protein L22
MSPEKPGQPPEGKPDEPAKLAEGAAEPKRTKAKAAKAETEGKAAKGEPKAKAEKPKAAKGEAKAKLPRKRKAAEKAEPQAEAKAAGGEGDTAQGGTEKAARAKVAKEPAPKGRSRRGKAPQKARRRVVRARARYVRTSARKARMVCGHLRGKSVAEARAILAFTPREVARDWSKLLESAVANAESNHELLQDDLIVREAYADEGPTIKRFRPRAMGRATPIRKRTSHLTITLTAAPENGAGGRRG